MKALKTLEDKIQKLLIEGIADIEARRIRLGMSIAELSRRSELSSQTYRNMAGDEKKVTPSTVNKYCDVLNEAEGK